MTTKYDWSNVPDNVQWIATDNDGVAHGFKNMPVIGEHGLWVSDDDYENYIGLNESLYDWFDYSNYSESLEQRP